MEVEEREVLFEEVKEFAECGLCGTAAVISPVGKVVDHGKEICFPSGMEEMGPVTKKLYDTLTGIQMGHIKLRKAGLKLLNRKETEGTSQKVVMSLVFSKAERCAWQS